MMMHPIVEEDHQRIHRAIAPLLNELKGKRLFVTGGTGFFGQWLLESLALANDLLSLDVDITVLSRDPATFNEEAPELTGREDLHLVQGDVRTFPFPQGTFEYIIHAATTRAEETFRSEDPLRKYDTVVQGTRRVLEFATQAGTEKVLWTSSGAMYGNQPAQLARIGESYNGAPDPMDPDSSALGVAKRSSEFMCAYYAKKHGFEIKIARCFSFVGPRLPLDIHYAVGNFIGDQVADRDIVIKGDGLAERSYMYITDLVIWLWHILLGGESLRPYNVGSPHSVSIRDLATQVSGLGKGGGHVQVLGKADPTRQISRYIPAVDRAQEELDLHLDVSLPDALSRTFSYYNTI